MRWRQLADVVLVSWLLAAALLLAGTDVAAATTGVPIDLAGWALILALHLPLYVRTWFPLPILLAVATAATVYLTLGYYHSVVTFAVALAVFTVAETRPRRTSVPGALLGWAVLLYAQRALDGDGRLFGSVVVTFILLVAWGFGDNWRQLRERGRRLAYLTEQLRREQQERAHQAVSQEQRRIARELHDVVAHHMSVISVQAGLGRYVLDADPQTARTALDVIAGTAHEALSEMRRLLAVLRVSSVEAGEPAQFDAAPGLDRLPHLLDRVRAAGATVTSHTEGEPVTLPPGLALCVYRVVQESLTNVLKHAVPPEATVSLTWRAQSLEVRVTDRGAPRRPESPSDVVRHGLIGMRERARIYGGTLSAGPRPQGGFEVRLTLPIGEHGDG
ncbi:sensor histidine kinase [Catellatospora methionotrophica]|uniref:sensor histidine kinase n=1 Tax=Catellatospora methionotrophica TaxID=121620 RepID=UPI0033FD565A